MANADKAYGFRPVNTTLSSGTALSLRQFLVDTDVTAAVFIGDPVKLAGSAGFVNAGEAYMPTVVKATTGDVVVGVVTGLVPRPGVLDTPQYVSTATTEPKRAVLVCTDPNQLYSIQADGTMTAAHVGRNADWTDSTGSTTTGISNAVLATSTVETATTLGLAIINIEPSIDNELGVYTRVLVQFNEHQYGRTTGALGV